jgi:hypothetical protein
MRAGSIRVCAIKDISNQLAEKDTRAITYRECMLSHRKKRQPITGTRNHHESPANSVMEGCDLKTK